MLKEEWDSAEEECGLEEAENEDEVARKNRTNPFKKLLDQLFSWLRQLPVIGFNSGHYDLNVIKKFYIPYMVKNNDIQFVIKRQNTFMCFSTPKLKFLDVTQYLAPGVSYDKYLKAYGCELHKGHFPYEYMDNLRKLDDCALPPQAAFFSRLKNEGISNDDYARCQAVWRDNGMETLREYLIWYNNRDVTPFLDAIAKQAGFYALYLWAIMQDMPTGWYTRRREENKFRPQQAQPFGQMAVQWLTWESAKSECAIRHQVNGREKRIGKRRVDGWCAETRTAYQFHGCFWHGCPKCYDQNETNSVNGKTMAVLLEDTKKNTAYLRRHVKVVEMWECDWKELRKEPDVKSFLAPARRQKWNMTQNEILAAVIDGMLFGMIECDIHVPPELRPYFSEMQPVFKNTTVTRDDIGPYMRQYAEEHNILTKPRRMLVGSYRGDKILLTTPLLRWYIAHGLVVDHVYQVVEYEPKPCFRNFGESVSTARRNGDVDPEKAIIGDTMKLLGNSAYGKTVTNVDKHRDVRYCTEVGTSSCINNKRFRQLDVVAEDAYEVTSSKARVTYDLPHHIGFFVYQYAKLRMLEFYYDFVDR